MQIWQQEHVGSSAPRSEGAFGAAPKIERWRIAKGIAVNRPMQRSRFGGLRPLPRAVDGRHYVAVTVTFEEREFLQSNQ